MSFSQDTVSRREKRSISRCRNRSAGAGNNCYAALYELDSRLGACGYGRCEKVNRRRCDLDCWILRRAPAGSVAVSASMTAPCGRSGNASNVLVGGSGDYDSRQTPNKRSIDGGTNWTKASTGLHPDSHDIVYAPSNPLIVYHGNDGGIFRSADGGATWTSLNNSGFSATQFEIFDAPVGRNT